MLVSIASISQTLKGLKKESLSQKVFVIVFFEEEKIQHLGVQRSVCFEEKTTRASGVQRSSNKKFSFRLSEIIPCKSLLGRLLVSTVWQRTVKQRRNFTQSSNSSSVPCLEVEQEVKSENKDKLGRLKIDTIPCHYGEMHNKTDILSNVACHLMKLYKRNHSGLQSCFFHLHFGGGGEKKKIKQKKPQPKYNTFVIRTVLGLWHEQIWNLFTIYGCCDARFNHLLCPGSQCCPMETPTVLTAVCTQTHHTSAGPYHASCSGYSLSR